MSLRRLIWIPFLSLGLLGWGQQTGSISGEVNAADGQALPGVAITAVGDVLPQPRSTLSAANGSFRFNLLPPGNYELTFVMNGMATVTRKAQVLLQQNTVVNVVLAPEATSAELVVVAEQPVIDPTSAEMKAAISSDDFEAIPVGQEYRDLVKLVPGVQYTENAVRGPSAGGSGQDNTYNFDGVNVTLPLFGTLSAEPATHDIDQVSVVKGGAKAQDFNRSGGFTINTISKAGTTEYKGEVSYQLQNESWGADPDVETVAKDTRDLTWLSANFGGPIVKDRLNFFVSYYGPEEDRVNRSNAYGEVPDYNSSRDEIFAKLTFSPTDRILLNASYRDSDRDITASDVGGSFTSATASSNANSSQAISILEGSFIINASSSINFKWSDFELKTASLPATLLSARPSFDGSTPFDVNNLDQMGRFSVPQLNADDPLTATLVNRYGFPSDSGLAGGGVVGAASQINNQDFFRDSFQIGYDLFLLTGDLSHDLHIGYQRYEDSEVLDRYSNGWGDISYLGGGDSDHPGAYFLAVFLQGTVLENAAGGVNRIESKFKSQNIEINDTMNLDNWTINVGFMLSNDELFGQGLAEDSSAVSGYRVEQGSTYRMYEVDWTDQIQPRLGLIYNFGPNHSAYANFARYNPAASSLPRAASWARNLSGLIYEAYLDENGTLIEATPRGSSSGKFFVPDMNPRTTDEYLIGYGKQLDSGWILRANSRYRYSYNFWEDTNNTARTAWGDAPDEIAALGDYIPELGDYRAEVGGSSYVIAELDNSFTKYYAAEIEGEWRGDNAYFRGSYVWSHYYGNMDQDNTTAGNDANVFIGSSNIADGPGRQLWNNKYGNLAGDRRHQFKLYGYYMFGWNGSAGAYGIYQSGAPWEEWNYETYSNITGSRSETIRFAEPAGSRTTGSHYQLDLNYTQNFKFASRYKLQLVLDIYNATDNQTGYNINPYAHSAGFGDPRSYYRPRRYQLALKFQF
ncbi:MAG: TonB-dependent receptor [Acidobacteria bacterium]|nr:TonB-dependent receptor [Acidobacteriota bacterium]